MSNPTDQPTWLDRFAHKYAPSWAASRADARLRIESIGKQREILATYRGGVATRLSTPWSASTSYSRGTIADRRLLGNMRDRGRRVWRENPLGRSILQTEVTNVVSDGFVLQAKTESKDFNRETEERWREWMDTADLTQKDCGSEFQRRMYRSPRRDGDGGVVLVDQGGRSQLQYIPGDLIKTPDAKQGDQYIPDGVEVDSSSRPIAYHVLDVDEYGKRDFSRIPASNFVFLQPDSDDDLSVRGPTCYSTIFSYLDQMDGYVDAVTTAARMACVFGLIFKDSSGAKQFQGLPTLTNSQGNQQKAITMENGSIKYIGTDGDVVQVQAQQPMNQTPDFIRALMRLIGMPFDMPLELVAHDMSQVNFASARIGLLGYYRACRARQRWFSDRCLSRIYRWWLSRERKRQQAGFSDAFVTQFPDKFWPHVFRARAWDYTDPVREAESDLLQISMRTKAPQDVAAERGNDYEDVQIQFAAAEALRRLHELPLNVLSNMSRDPILVTHSISTVQDPKPGQPTPELPQDPPATVAEPDPEDTIEEAE